ncbi:hypothetical protein ACYSNR_06235 [Enterococcus sp. LJL128]
MNLKKWGTFGLATTVILGSLLIGGHLSGASEKKIYIHDDQLRQELVRAASYDPETGEEIVIEDELPTAKQLETVESFSFWGASSIDGIQYAKNMKSLVFGASTSEEGKQIAIDFRPLGKLTNLEMLQCYSYWSEDETTYAVQDISYVKNLTNLTSLDFYHFPVLDLTPVSNLDNLIHFDTNTGVPVEIDSVAVSGTEKKVVMEHPVKYSVQFNDGDKSATGTARNENEEYSADISVQMDGNKLTIENIPAEATYIELELHATSKDYYNRPQNQEKYFSADTTVKVPLFWY